MGNPLRVLIVGGVACGPKAAARLKRLMPYAQVTMIERGKTISYGACGLPYFVEGSFPRIEELVETPAGIPRNAGFFKKVKGFETLVRTEALHIDREKKELLVRNLDTGEEQRLPYDKLVLATGGTPVRPPVPGLELGNVWTMRHPDDAQSLVERMGTDNFRRVVLMGAGYIGVEMAEALRAKGLQTVMIEMFDRIMPQFLDPELAMLAEKHLRQKGVELLLGERVEALEGDGVVRAVRTDKRVVETDCVLVGTGVRPSDGLARSAGIPCAPKGGIIIDSHCRTGDPDIYAGGDCVVNHALDPAVHDPLFIPLGSTANKHGRTIADHIADRSAPFAGISGTGVCRAFDFTLGRTGLTEKQAREIDPEVETAIWAGPDRPHYMPGAAPLIVKLVASRRSRKLMGMQIVGPGDASKRLDVAASALYFGASVDDLPGIDLGYAPPYSSPIDALAAAAHLMANKLDGIARGISPLEAKRRIDAGDDIVLLDVRTPQEFQAVRMPYPQVVHIPLGALREKADQLPRDKDILAFCKVSMRGYEAQLILNSMGFDWVCFIEGGLAAWPFETVTGS